MLLEWSISSQFILTPNENLKSVGARLCGACTMVLQNASWTRDCIVKPEVMCLVIHGPKRKRVFPCGTETYGGKQHRVSIWATTKTGHFVNSFWPVTKGHLCLSVELGHLCLSVELAGFELDDSNPWTRTIWKQDVFIFTYRITSSCPVSTTE